jgi:hypothetical protein
MLWCAVAAAAIVGCQSERSGAGDGRTAVTKQAIDGAAGSGPGGGGMGGFLGATTTSLAGGGMAGSGMAGSGMAGSGMAGSGMAGSGMAGSGMAGGAGGAGMGGDTGAGGLMAAGGFGGMGGAGGDTSSGTTTDSWTYTGPDDAIVCEADADTSDDGSGLMFVFAAADPPLNGNGNEVITAAQCRVACAQAGQPNGVCRELCRGLKKAGCRGLLSWCDHLLRHRQKQAAEACYATHIALGCPGRN